MRNSFDLFDVAREIFRMQFHSSKKEAEKMLLRGQKQFR